jgi:hypothetical protein
MTTIMKDKRRYGVIEVRRVNDITYHLTIGGRLWAEVEWSSKRRMWCVQDACGFCLTHVESIVGQDRDPQAAIRLAKKMIVDGSMPSPEQARHQFQQRNAQEAAQRTAERAKASTKASTKKQTKTQTKKRKPAPKAKKPEPLGELIVGDITARSEPVPVRIFRNIAKKD